MTSPIRTNPISFGGPGENDGSSRLSGQLQAYERSGKVGHLAISLKFEGFHVVDSVNPTSSNFWGFQRITLRQSKENLLTELALR